MSRLNAGMDTGKDTKKIILKNKNTPFVIKRYKKKQTRTNLAWLERTEF